MGQVLRGGREFWEQQDSAFCGNEAGDEAEKAQAGPGWLPPTQASGPRKRALPRVWCPGKVGCCLAGGAAWTSPPSHGLVGRLGSGRVT